MLQFCCWCEILRWLATGSPDHRTGSLTTLVMKTDDEMNDLEMLWNFSSAVLKQAVDWVTGRLCCDRSQCLDPLSWRDSVRSVNVGPMLHFPAVKLQLTSPAPFYRKFTSGNAAVELVSLSHPTWVPSLCSATAAMFTVLGPAWCRTATVVRPATSRAN